ncbi:hypothetical protein C8J57DRAFT_1082265 [Mycena rebaudengoi]|nr:hypothetical protein C8J57DRAFT_1082265 [Mycena rebaudengoi]
MPHPRSLPPPPQTQALSSTTFTPPPLDGRLTIAEMYDWHFKNTPDHRLFVFTQKDGSTRTILWPEAVQAIYVGAKILRNRFGWIAGTNETPIVAVLASSDTIPYFTLIMSCLRANYLVFLVSPRNSPSAVAYLIDRVGVNYLLIGHDPAMLDLSTNAVNILKEQYPRTTVPDVSHVPLFEDLFLSDPERTLGPEDIPYEYSGSTAFPKPIYWSHHRTIQLALIPWFGERDLTDQVLSLHCLPMYHVMGVLHVMWGASCGPVFSAFEPNIQPTVPTPENLFRTAKATSADLIFCVPAFIEAWSREPEYIKWLATRSGVLYGGGPLNQEVGDHLTSQGVSVFILYGSTEGGVVNLTLPVQVGYDWNYFKLSELVTAEMVPHSENTFELVMVSNVFCRPSVLNTKIGGSDAYATSDLLVPHPSKPGYWKIFGRTDDQIMHNTGEKTNPGPLESILNQDPHVLSSVMFGRGQFQAGVLVDPKPAYKFDPSDSAKLAEFRNLICGNLNAFAPQHSRIFKEMILVAKPSKPFTYTAKLTARRQAIIIEYANEITDLYAAVDETTQSSIIQPHVWNATSTVDFVRQLVRSIMNNAVEDEDDVFHHGCDSLQATWIRNSLLRALRDSIQLDPRQSAHNFVYDHPSIARLAHFVLILASGSQREPTLRDKLNLMHDMVSAYAQDFPIHAGNRKLPPSDAKVIMITGTTGELGCYLLSVLVADRTVSRIFAVNRASRDSKSLQQRNLLALVGRGLDPSILDSQKLVLVEGDTSAIKFAVADPLYGEMQNSVTHIIHSAWPVDFNMTLASFAPNVRGVRNIIDFALGSPFCEPPKLLYTSSIGIFQSTHNVNPLMENPIDAEIAVGTGYTESKWVSEEIIARSAEFTPLKSLVVRVGQLCGGINGAWNANEWFPALIQSASIVGCIPEDDKVVSWLPVDVAAAAILDFLSQISLPRIVHLVHPQPVPWSALGHILAIELSTTLVPYAQWLSCIEEQQATNSLFRAGRLLSFFRSLNQKAGGEAFGLPKLDMKYSLGMSTSLRALSRGIGKEEVKRWIKYWEDVGLS